jgi:RNA polymerase sigma-70 factor (ECF subfamily)
VARDSSNSEQFEALAMPLFASLYNLAHWLTQDRSDAEDLVQETYLKALKGFASFQPGTNFRAWIYRILRNTFLTSRAGLAQHMDVPLEDEEGEIDLPSTGDTPEGVLLAQADQQMVAAALEKLPVQAREIILLCDVEEMSYREIADTLGVPIGTVMSRISRARGALRKLLEPRKEGATQ